MKRILFILFTSLLLFTSCIDPYKYRNIVDGIIKDYENSRIRIVTRFRNGKLEARIIYDMMMPKGNRKNIVITYRDIVKMLHYEDKLVRNVAKQLMVIYIKALDEGLKPYMKQITPNQMIMQEIQKGMATYYFNNG